MKKTLTILACTLLAASVVLLIGCGSEQSQTETTTQQPAPAKQTADAAATKGYPLDFCLVSGEKLGSMGDPVVKTYAGHEVKFCCDECVGEFEANMPMFMAKLDSLTTGTLEMPGHEGHDHDGHDHDGHDHSHGG